MKTIIIGYLYNGNIGFNKKTEGVYDEKRHLRTSD